VGALQFVSAEDIARQFEGCRLEAYQDLAGVWTIGYGHTGKDVYQGLVWTQEQADDALLHDINVARALLEMYSPQLSNGTLDALTDFVFNLGIGNYRTSTLCTLVNAENWSEVKLELLKWDHSNGIVVPGLLRRREAEAALIA
jgi:lysozyme